jgi:hypothetical protein
MPSAQPVVAEQTGQRRAERALKGDDRVRVHGRVHLGNASDLVQERVPISAAPTRRFLGGIPQSGVLAPVDLPPGLQDTSIPSQRLKWVVRNTPGEVYITDDGLTSSYGIFGAPGSGKTFMLMRILGQLFQLDSKDPDRRCGALILDPKAALVDDVRQMAAVAGRTDDLVVLSAEDLAREDRSVNIISTGMAPRDVGKLLVLAGQSAGSQASEPFWFGAWTNLFSPALQLLAAFGEERPNLRTLTQHVLSMQPGLDGTSERPIQALARRARSRLDTLPPDIRSDLEVAVEEIEAFYRQEPENVETVNALITGAYGDFRLSEWRRFTPLEMAVPGAATPAPFYDQIVDQGKIVLVSVSPNAPVMAKTICTVVKVLFQQVMNSRLSRVRAGTLHNFERPVVLACDEYSGLASEVPGQPVGDAHFLSLCRQSGTLVLLATQSVTMLQNSGLKDAWKAALSVMGAKLFLRVSDAETAEEATKLVGQNDWVTTSVGASFQAGGGSHSSQQSLQEHKELPTTVLTQVLTQGQCVAVGSLDGNRTIGAYAFVVADERPADAKG